MNEDDTVRGGDGPASWTLRIDFVAAWSVAWSCTATAAGAPDEFEIETAVLPPGDGARDTGATDDRLPFDQPFPTGAAASLSDDDANLAPETSPFIPAVRPLSRDDAFAPAPARDGPRVFMVMTIMVGLLVALGWRFLDVSGACALAGRPGIDMADRLAADTVARRIVRVESNGDANAKNPLSSATGAGQFLDGTWLDMIRAYRPDLSGREEAEILELRRDPALSREMVARFAEENAAMLVRRCLPVTAGTLYLSHFAGGAGAAAVLLAREDADAATTMAEADSTGRTTRAMIVRANPFLARFTVADLRKWADRKMGL